MAAGQFFYASANVVAGGITFSECSCVLAFGRESRTNIVSNLARYRWYLLTKFYQTFTIDGFWSKNECVKFCGQKVKGQGHGEVKYVPKCTFWPCNIVICWGGQWRSQDLVVVGALSGCPLSTEKGSGEELAPSPENI